MPILGENLRDLAERFLNDKGQTDVQLYLEDGETFSAQITVLGGIDRAWKGGEITDEEAREAVEKTGLTPEQTANIRSQSTRL